MMTSLCLSDRGVNHAGNFLGEKTKPSEYPVETLASTLAEESGLDVMLKPQQIFAMFKSFCDNMSARIRADNLAIVVTISEDARTYQGVLRQSLTRTYTPSSSKSIRDSSVIA